MTAWSRTPGPVRQAVDDGVLEVAAATLEEALRDADLVLLAAPPLACLDLIDEIGGAMRVSLPEGATVTDAASSKARIVARADAMRLPFIGGHPMAGREVSGYAAALPDLFVGRPWVTVAESLAGGPGVPERPDWQAAEALAATGWAGMTRLARGEPAMGAGIAATNSAAIASRLRDLRGAIDGWLVELEQNGGPDADALEARFASAKDRLEESDSR